MSHYDHYDDYFRVSVDTLRALPSQLSAKQPKPKKFTDIFQMVKQKAMSLTKKPKRSYTVHQSLPEMPVPQHVRTGSLRPLPTRPVPPPRQHMRRPTGPRELPDTLQSVIEQKSKLSEIQADESKLVQELSAFMNLVTAYTACQDKRLSQAIKIKMQDIKQVEQTLMKKVQQLLSEEDDDETIGTNGSCLSESNSTEFLKSLSNKLDDVGRKRQKSLIQREAFD